MKPLSLALITWLILLPVSASACEPVIPLAKLFGGPNYFILSLWWLLIAVAVKVSVFVYFERQIKWYEAIAYIVVANIVSSLVGVFVAWAASFFVAWIIALPIVYMMSVKPLRRLAGYLKKDWSHLGLEFWFCPAATMGATVLFEIAAVLRPSSEAGEARYIAYWVLKFGYVAIALSVSIALTSLWEEWVVASMVNELDTERNYFRAIVRANYTAAVFIFAAAALRMLPRRLDSPNFLVRAGEWLAGLPLAPS